ncbi:FxLD family lanthipeptide [Streptomyces sp. RK75]|uniref:FxLD family lanthipeptide n=1 Tax=Streptomyces sp. RK75 TaxID=2824895 RepID=UPI001B36F44B|nr:FxLD family lanthipeptide [Streptomyces sp. RK75]MBQ0863068.1 FxLD family lanthipeptide [Streptomyces sp. RK75]
MSPTAALAERPHVVDEDDFAPLDVKVVVATHPIGKLMCSTGDGCGSTCSGGSSACSSFIEDPA